MCNYVDILYHDRRKCIDIFFLQISAINDFCYKDQSLIIPVIYVYIIIRHTPKINIILRILLYTELTW